MYRILYLNQTQFESIILDVLFSLGDLTFDNAVHFIEDTNQYACIFKAGDEPSVRSILTDFNPNLELTFETFTVP